MNTGSSATFMDHHTGRFIPDGPPTLTNPPKELYLFEVKEEAIVKKPRVEQR
jgi:hypothetical protein